MTLQGLVETYGYAAILIGAFLEGETIMILGGMAAQLGYLELPWVIASAFAGTLFGDQLYFYLGRRYGHSHSRRRPQWRAATARVLHMLHRKQLWLILGFRILYGLRTVALFVIGMSEVTITRFLLLNAIGAAAWVMVVGTLSYLFGHLFEAMMGKLKHHELEVMGIIVFTSTLVWALHFYRSRRRTAERPGPPSAG